MTKVCVVDSFDFGTSVEGIYFFNITIYCKVPCVNIAYAIVKVEKIADGTNPNDPIPPPDDDGTTNRPWIYILGIQIICIPNFLLKDLFLIIYHNSRL